MTTLNTDPIIALSLVFIIGCLFGAVCVEILVAKHLNRERAEIDRLRGLISPFDRDHDGKPGGSKPR